MDFLGRRDTIPLVLLGGGALSEMMPGCSLPSLA